MQSKFQFIQYFRQNSDNLYFNTFCNFKLWFGKNKKKRKKGYIFHWTKSNTHPYHTVVIFIKFYPILNLVLCGGLSLFVFVFFFSFFFKFLGNFHKYSLLVAVYEVWTHHSSTVSTCQTRICVKFCITSWWHTCLILTHKDTR